MTDALRDAWLHGRADRLGARGEAFAWALRKAWYAQGNGEYGLLKFVNENTSKPDGSELDLFIIEKRYLHTGFLAL